MAGLLGSIFEGLWVVFVMSYNLVLGYRIGSRNIVGKEKEILIEGIIINGFFYIVLNVFNL